MTRRRLILIAGSGSTTDFLTRAFGSAALQYGLSLHPYAVRSTDPLEDGLEYFDGLQPGPRDIVGGVSVGAHLAARWAATRHAGNPSAPGLLAVMPGWTGAPDQVAAVTVRSAYQLRSMGTKRVIEQLRAEERRTGAMDQRSDTTGQRCDATSQRSGSTGRRWVVDELAAAWPTYGDQLAGVLTACGRLAGPTEAELRAIAGQSVVLSLTDDPMHPLSTATVWTAHLGRATLRTLTSAQVGSDRASLGRTALAAFS